MDKIIANLELKAFHDQSARTRNNLIILRRSLEECLVSWKDYGFADVHNPVAVSIRRDIHEHQLLLNSSEQRLHG